MNFDFMRDRSTSNWTPDEYYCTICGEVIFSRYPGHFCSCGCGESFVDQTQEYTRLTVDTKPVPKEVE